jgi:hypothetical protein
VCAAALAASLAGAQDKPPAPEQPPAPDKPKAAPRPSPVMAPSSMVGAGASKENRPAPQHPIAWPLKLEPHVWPRSSYSFEGRIETAIGNVSFKAPPEYQQSFDFWTGRMKDTDRSELIQQVTSTAEAEEGGAVPFHRSISRFSLDINDRGQIKTPFSEVPAAVQKLAWDGKLDPQGRITEVRRTAAPEDTSTIDRLAFPVLDHALPVLGAPRTLKAGETIVLEESVPLPSRLTIAGLEEQAVLMRRVLTPREMQGDEITFDVKTTYAADPATPPKAERTTCIIGGGGDGEVVFNRSDGIFVHARLESKLVIDIEAPLRALPNQAPGSDPGRASVHIDMSLKMNGKQSVARLFFPPKSDPPAPAAGN